MRNGRKNALTLGLTVTMVLVAAWGCTRKNAAPPPVPMQGETLSTNERAVIVHPAHDGTRRYYRDTSGMIYYVDQGGAVHTVERKARVEQGVGGLYYIIDDDDVQYSTDENGRLYYQDSGGPRYIEEIGSGRVIDPLPIMRGDSYPHVQHVRSLETCNNEWRTCRTKCDNAPGLGSKRSCFENCDYQKEQCLKPD